MPHSSQAIVSSYLDTQNLISRFIDPLDIVKARKAFSRSPWNYYLKPWGQYPKAAWDYFKKASAAILASSKKKDKRGLSVEEILDLYSLLMFGHKGQANQSLRVYSLTYNDRTNNEIQRCFGVNGKYRNPDGLNISVAGFWPVGEHSLDLACARLNLSRSTKVDDQAGCKEAIRQLKRILYKKVNSKAERWHIYWLFSPQERLNQLEEILRWYNKEIKFLFKLQDKGDASFRRELISLAVKMQRYMDAAHIFPDGSGRMSRLISDYVFLRFGIMPPQPILYFYDGKYYENGTYLPFSKALDRIQQGFLAR